MRSKSLAGFICGIVGVVLGIVSYFLFGWLSFIALVLGILSVVFGGLGIKDREGGYATAALVLGIICVIVSLVAVILYIIVLAAIL